MTPPTDFAVGLLGTEAGHDSQLVQHLTVLINDVYAVAERGLWRDGATRTTAAELADLIASQQIVVATAPNGLIVGSIRIRTVSDRATEFGMLVAAPEQRGTGVGRILVEYAERYSADRGFTAIQLELLVPRTWQHPSKEFLKSWYGRIGYRLIGSRSVDGAYPHFAELLATPCEIEVHEKSLSADHRSGRGA